MPLDTAISRDVPGPRPGSGGHFEGLLSRPLVSGQDAAGPESQNDYASRASAVWARLVRSVYEDYPLE
jgi:hypothetical protein